VLLVDDEPNLLEISSVYLERDGDLSVRSVSSVEEALLVLEEEIFDVIVSDYQMPERNGLELLKDLKGRGNGIPFILFTGRGREEVAIEALNLGADFYIQKGGQARAQFEELKNAIRQVVARTRVTNALRIKNLELMTLYDASKVMGSTLDLRAIYNSIHESIVQMMECDALLVTAYNEKDEMINCLFAWHNEEPVDVAKLPSIPLAPPGHGTQSQVIRTGESILLGNYVERVRADSNVRYYVDDDGEVHEDIPDEEPTQSALIVPLKHRGKVLGVIQVFSDRPNAYSEDDLRILESLSVHAAHAISNGILYENAISEAEGRRQAKMAFESLMKAMEELGKGILLIDMEKGTMIHNDIALKRLDLQGEEDLLERVLDRLDLMESMNKEHSSIASFSDEEKMVIDIEDDRKLIVLH